jgi:hypothetical protein
VYVVTVPLQAKSPIQERSTRHHFPCLENSLPVGFRGKHHCSKSKGYGLAEVHVQVGSVGGVPKKITEASLVIVRQGLIKPSVKQDHVVVQVISVFVREFTYS